MTYVELAGDLPESWVKKSAKKIAEIKSKAFTRDAPDNVYHYLEQSRNQIWGDLKSWLSDASGLSATRKCWFSESPNDGSHLHVEHFRPKAKVLAFNGFPREKYYFEPFLKELQKGIAEHDTSLHPAYWWLAYSHTNYALAGSVVNSAYKGNFFPLVPSGSVAKHHDEDIAAEIPYLLSPCVKGEPELITFNAKGYALPLYSSAEEQFATQRARALISIIVYGLNDPTFVYARRLTWEKTQRRLRQVRRWLHKPSLYKPDIATVLKEMATDASPKAHYAGTVRACIQQYAAASPNPEVVQHLETFKTKVLQLAGVP